MYNPVLTQAVSQTTTISPRQMQSVSILQMDLAQLETYINEQIEENPVIEQNEELPPIFPTSIQSSAPFREARQQNSGNMTALDFAAAPDESGTLEAFIRDQIERKELPGWQTRLCLYIAGCLDQGGYLRSEEREALYQELPFSQTLIDRSIQILQTLEPAGLAAKNIEECLLLQLERLAEPCDVAKQIVKHYLPELARKRFSYLSKQLKCPSEKVQRAVRQIMTLNPKPGTAFTSPSDIQYILPDVYITRTNDKLDIVVNNQHIGQLRINHEYTELYETTDCPETKEYLREKITQATWLMSCLEQRRSTLERCVRHIVELQPDFFIRHNGNLRPMTLADVAKLANIHESTVCRAVKGKYLVCTEGTFPLGYFFSNAVRGENDTASSQSVKVFLQALIRQENKHAPLSDQQLQQLLEKEQGVTITRRTVAKYRTALRIPPVGERRIS